MKNSEDDFIIMQNQEVMADWFEVQDKLWEMEIRDNKFVEMDDVFEIDFS